MLIAQPIGHKVHNEALSTDTNKVDEAIKISLHHPPFGLFPYLDWGRRHWAYHKDLMQRKTHNRLLDTYGVKLGNAC